MATAKTLVQTSIAQFLDLAGGVGVGLFFSAFTAFASTIAPLPPHLETFFIVGAGPVGFMIEMAFGNSGLYDKVAELLTNGLFDGAQALSNALDRIANAVTDAVNPFDGREYDPLDSSQFEASPDPDDVYGIDPTYHDFAAFESAELSQHQLQVQFVGDGWGDFETDEPIAAPVHEGPLVINEPLMQQEIQIV